MDTRTPRGIPANEPVLNTVKVPCDPAQVVVNHASFRVLLRSGPAGGAAAPDGPDAWETSRLPRITAGAGRRRPLVWTGRSAPGDPGATTLVQAARAAGLVGDATGGGAGAGGADATATRVLPRVRPTAAGAGLDELDATRALDLGSALIGPRGPQPVETTQPLRPVRDGARSGRHAAPEETIDARRPGRSPRPAGRGHDGRQAFYPGRRMSLGVVLLPLRVLLGFIALYAGMGKLTDPKYFDGGERGSLYAWLSGLEPWGLASPLHDWALAHPVGAGLTVAFTQIIAGVLTIFGLWQRLGAALGATLSLALLVTVSWQHGPAYDTPDVILLAAWSPLVIAGAPVYSLDARLAGEAWRMLGPRAPLAQLRRRVLRRGSALAALLLGLALLIGSMLGSAVRSTHLPRLPEPGEPPVNHLPGEPLPDESTGGRRDDDDESAAPSAEERADPGGAEDEDPATGTPAERQDTERVTPEPDDPTGGTGELTGTVEQPPTTEQTVPAPEEQSAPPPVESAPEEEAAVPDAGTGEVPAEESAPADEGGEQSSLGPIGGLLG